MKTKEMLEKVQENKMKNSSIVDERNIAQHHYTTPIASDDEDSPMKGGEGRKSLRNYMQ